MTLDLRRPVTEGSGRTLIAVGMDAFSVILLVMAAVVLTVFLFLLES
jgi:hypothetical protein